MHKDAIHKMQNKVSRADVSIVMKLIVQKLHGSSTGPARYTWAPRAGGKYGAPSNRYSLTFWRRNYFFNFSTPCI